MQRCLTLLSLVDEAEQSRSPCRRWSGRGGPFTRIAVQRLRGRCASPGPGRRGRALTRPRLMPGIRTTSSRRRRGRRRGRRTGAHQGRAAAFLGECASWTVQTSSGNLFAFTDLKVWRCTLCPSACKYLKSCIDHPEQEVRCRFSFYEFTLPMVSFIDTLLMLTR